MTALIVFLGVIAFTLLSLLLAFHRWQKHMRALEELARALVGGRAVTPRDLTSTYEQCSVTGRLDGHDVALHLTRSDKTLYAIVQVRAQNAAATFDVREASTLERLGRWLGVAGEGHVDAGMVLREGAGDARRLMQATGVRAALRSVLDLRGVHSVSLEGSVLRIQQRLPDLEPQALLAVFRTLIRLARRCGRVPVTVTAHDAKPRFAWTDGEAEARCPYCRDALDPASEAAVGCGRCQTVHHRACLDEAGGCTIFGCGERARAPEKA